MILVKEISFVILHFRENKNNRMLNVNYLNCQSMLHTMTLANTIRRVASKTMKAIMSLETSFNTTETREMFVLHSL